MITLKALQEFAKNMTENFSVHVDAQPEDQLKPAVTNLLKSAGQDKGKHIVVRTEARHGDVQGRPDLGVAINNLLAGFIELKAPGLGSNPTKLKGEQNKKQWQNFKSIPNLVYTDGNEWSLFRTGEQIGKTVESSALRDRTRMSYPTDTSCRASLWARIFSVVAKSPLPLSSTADAASGDRSTAPLTRASNKA